MEKALVVEIFERAKKAADMAAAAATAEESGGCCPEEERCLDALNQLKQLHIPRDVLVSTQIGKRLRQLSRHPSKRIQALSSDVIKTLKRAFLDELHKEGKNINGDHQHHHHRSKSVQVGGSQTKDAITKTQKSVTSKDSKKQGKQGMMIRPKSKAAAVPVGAPTPNLASLPKTNVKNRDIIREVFAKSLWKVADEVDDGALREAVGACDPCSIAATVETELFKKWGSYNDSNKFKYRSVMFNIKDPKNPDLRRKVLLGVFPPEIIWTLTAEDMASEARRLENNEIREKAMFDCELVQSMEASSMDMKCGKCGKSQTIYHQMQTRRADEPMTTFVTCLNCNHHWKF